MTEQLTEAYMQQPDVPPLIREAYDISPVAVVEKLSGGRVNTTLLVQDKGKHTVLRCLSDKLDALVLEDTQVVSGHLATHGWEAPRVLPAVDGTAYKHDESGQLWHHMSFIASDGQAPSTITSTLTSTAGTMLGNWHTTVGRLNYTPRFGLPHFHDSPYIAAQLTDQLPLMPNKQTYALADELLSRYTMLPYEPAGPEQLIHGDPKLDNMLFRNGEPFTLIDFDTLMRGSRWIDVGDFLRSLTAKMLQNGGSDSPAESFVSAYHESGGLTMSADEAWERSRRATGRIALELGMRYLSDIVDGQKYFDWDPRYGSRCDHHRERAEVQLQVANHALRGA